MTELFGGLSASLTRYIQSWLLPSIIGVGFFSGALLPAVKEEAPWSGIFQMTPTERAILFVFSAVILSFLLASTARELTRLLEGYTSIWPSSLKKRWTKKQKKTRKDLRKKIAESSSQLEQSRLREQLDQYPRDPDLILPTRLGNALRAGETYGFIQYGLSTVDFWTRLTALAEDKVNDQLAQSRAVLNFFVAMIWLSGVLSLTTLAIVLSTGDAPYLLWIAPLVALMPIWYGRAVTATVWYAQAMQALVDLTRTRLAQELGIKLPGDLEEERQIWLAVTGYAAWGPNWAFTEDWTKIINDATVPRGAKKPD